MGGFKHVGVRYRTQKIVANFCKGIEKELTPENLQVSAEEIYKEVLKRGFDHTVTEIKQEVHRYFNDQSTSSR